MPVCKQLVLHHKIFLIGLKGYVEHISEENLELGGFTFEVKNCNYSWDKA